MKMMKISAKNKARCTKVFCSMIFAGSSILLLMFARFAGDALLIINTHASEIVWADAPALACVAYLVALVLYLTFASGYGLKMLLIPTDELAQKMFPSKPEPLLLGHNPKRLKK